MRIGMMFALAAAACLGKPAPAQAQYRPPPREEAPAETEDPFSEKVDLERFRKGSPDWDTQELVASGLRALHEDHRRILEELRQLRADLNDLREQREARRPSGQEASP